MQLKGKRLISVLGATLAWASVILQFILMIENRITSIPETIVRFFSFFTILTNTLVAIYYTSILQKTTSSWHKFFSKPGISTALAVYITIVGLVYQLILRGIWEPQGLQMIVDELLHSIIPVYYVLFWILSKDKSHTKWNNISQWMLYPIVYVTYVMLRGSLSGFYPYPFINPNALGYQQVLVNIVGLLLFFIMMSALFIFIAKKTKTSQ